MRFLKTMMTVTVTLAICSATTVNAQKVERAHYYKEYSDKYTQNQLAPEVEPGMVFYVSPEGKDKNEGTKEKPFQTLEKARDAVRELKASEGMPEGGVQVVLLEGVYPLMKPLLLFEEDGGTAESPVVYKAEKQGKVILTSGKQIKTKGFKVVKDKKLVQRLHKDAVGKVMSIDLSGEVLNIPGEGKYGQLSMDGNMLQIAQWPNRGYHHLKEVVECGPTTRWLKPGEKAMGYSKENPTGGKFTIREELSPKIQKEFERTGDMRAQGYFHNDWYFQDEPVGGVEDGVVQLLHHTRYGIVEKIKSIPRRVRILNVLAELNEPGEWYYDQKDKRLYVWPIDGFKPGKSSVTFVGSMAESVNNSFMQPGKDRGQTKASVAYMENTSYVTFRDFIIESTADLGIEIKDGEYNLLAGNVFRNGSGKGASINGGKYNGITACDFYDLYAAFNISGGDFKSLEHCFNFATNNEIRNCRIRGYGLIGLNGVGIYFAHNLLHDMNGAVMYRTVNLLMEYNEFYNIGYEMGDFNVAYCGAQWYTMNNVVRYNFVHHLIEPGGHPVCAFRNDDNGAGLKIYGNMFYKPGRAASQGDGPLNDIQNNIVIDANFLWWTLKKPIDAEGIQKKWKEMEKFGVELPKGDKGDYIYIVENIIGEKGWEKSPWLETFPELKAAIDLNPFAQTFGHVNRNYSLNVREDFHIHGGDGTVEGMESGEVGRFIDLPLEGEFRPSHPITMDAFEDPSVLNFKMKDDFEVISGFRKIPFEEIGLVKDQYRTNPPCKDEYRKAIFERYENDRGGRYDAEKVNARYPVPGYLR